MENLLTRLKTHRKVLIFFKLIRIFKIIQFYFLKLLHLDHNQKKFVLRGQEKRED